MYVLVFVSGENLTPVGYFTNREDCVEAGALAYYVEKGMRSGNPFDYMCVKVEGLLNK
jgi:hypothetical protein